MDSGHDGISTELFKILNDDAVKVLLYAANCSKFRKLSRPQNRKRSVFILIPKILNAKECSNYHVVVLQSLSHLGLCNPMNCNTPDFSVFHCLPEFTQSQIIESVMPSNHLILCRPFSSRLQSFPASRSLPMSQLFTSGSQYWSFSFSISPSNGHSGLISFRIDWFDLLAVQGTVKSLLQHHSSEASVLW